MFGILTAYASPEATAEVTPAGGIMGAIVSFLPMIIIFVLLYFMMVRPQKKQQKLQMEMRNNLKVGDKVVTVGGICGKVAKIKDDFIWIESSLPGAPEDKSYIKFKKNAIDSLEKSAE